MADQVCRRCLFCSSTGQYVELPTIDISNKSNSQIGRKAQKTLKAGAKRKRRRLGTLTCVSAAVIPGFGHALSGRYRPALFYCIMICLLAYSGSSIHSRFGQICLGLASALHAYSIFDILQRHIHFSRIASLMVLSFFVLFTNLYFYWPWAERINRSFNKVAMVRGPHLFESSRWADIIGFCVITGIILLASHSFFRLIQSSDCQVEK
jgi:hypothetical protein